MTPGTGSISNVETQRDPALMSLENAVFGKIGKILQEHGEDISSPKKEQIQIVSVESALRELLEIEKNTNS